MQETSRSGAIRYRMGASARVPVAIACARCSPAHAVTRDRASCEAVNTQDLAVEPFTSAGRWE